MDLAEVAHFDRQALERPLREGLAAFAAAAPMSLDTWARKHFYLSAESSYVEQHWTPWPFQPGLMALMSCDDVEIFGFRKSARIGYTKMLLADVLYNGQHKRRNQGIWQPTDFDADDFVKTDLDPALRDVAIMSTVFPAYLRRHKDNTLGTKRMLGSITTIRGAKAAKNFRRLTLDTAHLDEIDGMDRNVEKEGSPVDLAWKRTEGATFRKLIAGTTPKIKGASHIEDLEAAADLFLRFHFACPHCGQYHPLEWGGKEEPHGIKWPEDNPEDVTHWCRSCGQPATQLDYTHAAEAGRVRWQTDDGVVLHIESDEVVFRTLDGARVPTPRRVSAHLWTAYSPGVTWADIVQEFLNANQKAQTGDNTGLVGFTNLTLGETWEVSVQKTDANELKARAEPYRLRCCPPGVLRLYTFVDVQGNRLEAHTWGFGRGCETWPIDLRIFHGNPAEETLWDDVADYYATPIPTHNGGQLAISAMAIDEGGHHQHAVRHFVRKMTGKRVYATHGRPGREKAIKDGTTKVDIDWKGRLAKNAGLIWWIGTRLAKDLMLGRLSIEKPGPGYIHFSQALTDDWFAQFTAEHRTEAGQWEKDRPRNEALDGHIGCLFLAEIDSLATRGPKWWDAQESKIVPVTADLFAAPAPEDQPAPPQPTPAPQPKPTTSAPPTPPKLLDITPKPNFVTNW